MSPKVIKVEPLANYQLRLTFSNGEIRRFDVTPYLDKGIFTELQNLEYFHQVQLSFGSIQWPHEQDFSPDTLYLTSKPEEQAVNYKSSLQGQNSQRTIQHLPPEAIHSLIPHLPDYIKVALLQKAAELECSLEAAIEMAIASFLDKDAFSFEDCLLSQRLQDSKQG